MPPCYKFPRFTASERNTRAKLLPQEAVVLLAVLRNVPQLVPGRNSTNISMQSRGIIGWVSQHPSPMGPPENLRIVGFLVDWTIPRQGRGGASDGQQGKPWDCMCTKSNTVD